MDFLSVCSGIEAATEAWTPLGFRAVGYSEIDPFASAVLAHRHPGTENFGDMTEHKRWNHERADILIGGTPCQAFSIAGLRKGMDDPRGNLALVYLSIADEIRADWLVWENVPGVLSSNEGRDFGTFLGALGELGYGFAYRILNAEHFGVPQRRNRVILVAHTGGWQRAAAVLFEHEGLRRNPPQIREAEADAARCVTARSGGASAKEQQETFIGRDGEPLNGLNGSRISCRPDGISGTVSNKWHKGAGGPSGDEHYNLIAPIPIHDKATRYRGGGDGRNDDGSGNGLGVGEPGDMAHCLAAGDRNAVAFDTTQITNPHNRSNPQPGAPCHTLAAGAHPPALASSTHVRRLTPLECERLQGFPDEHTRVPYRGKPAEACPDSPRYKAIGNSMAVPVIRWLGERIQMVEDIT